MKIYGLKHVVLMVVFFALSGCAISQKIDPVKMEIILNPEICMIAKNSGVRKGFSDAYRTKLQEKGFTVIQLPAASSPFDCHLSTEYTAMWSWDLRLYMSYAEIKVFENGRPIGQAIYDARKGSGLLTKFINTENKIHELTDELFPQSAPRLMQ